MGDAEWQQKWQHALEPTYEGLKHYLAGAGEGGTPPLEPTYEGLKQFSPNILQPSVQRLWSLPMRD